MEISGGIEMFADAEGFCSAGQVRVALKIIIITLAANGTQPK